MAVRTGMVDLVNTLELLVQDTSNNDLSEDEYQDILDLQSHRIIRHCLVPLDKDGKYWRASCGYFESDTRAPELKDYDDNTLSHTADYNNGVFILDTPDDTIQVYLWDGYVYNIYAAAYLACNLLIAKIKNEYSITVAEGSFSRFDRVETLEKLGMMYSSMSDTFTVPMSDYDYTSTIYQRDNYRRW
jgi:hypothetical protein